MLVYHTGILALWYNASTKTAPRGAFAVGRSEALAAELFRGNSRRIATEEAGAKVGALGEGIGRHEDYYDHGLQGRRWKEHRRRSPRRVLQQEGQNRARRRRS